MKPSREASSLQGPTLITGGTGSLGQALVRRFLAKDSGEIRIYSRDEHKQFLMRQRFDDSRLTMYLGDVRDKSRLAQAMRGCHQVVHLAAMKHVPACEANPGEAIQTNITGALNLAGTAIDAGAAKVLFVSTDKAVSPTNLYGATKLVAEKALLAANNLPGAKTRFAGIRFGNFFASRGNVVSLFHKQKHSGTLSLTDLRMTRFWMTLDQAANFTLARLETELAEGLYIPKMRALALKDLAKAIAPECGLREIGRRAGEKLHEHLINADEAHLVREMEDYYVLFSNPMPDGFGGGHPVPLDFQMRSDLSASKWTSSELDNLLSDQDSGGWDTFE